MAPIFFVSESAAESLLQWDEVVSWIADAYRHDYSEADVPARVVATSKDAWLRVLTAIPPGARYFGAKLMGAARAENPAVQYAIVLFDRTTSRIAGLVDGNFVTGCRTAATSAAALDRLAPRRPISLAVLGSGFEATTHVRAIAAIRPLAQLHVYSPTPARREAFAQRFSAELKIACRAFDRPEDAVRTADVVVAAARSRGEMPILYGSWLKPATAVISIGSTIPSQREIDSSVVERCDLIVCDSVQEVLHASGDMLEAARVGIHFAQKTVAFSTLVRGEVVRPNPNGISMFKSVGSGLQDMVVAGKLLEKAIAAGRATALPVQFSDKLI